MSNMNTSNRKQTSIIAVSNQKGGVGKTSTAVTISVELAVNHDKRVLLVDMDGQGNASSAIASSFDDNLYLSTMKDIAKERGQTITSGLLNDGMTVADLALRTPVKNLDIICADMTLETQFARKEVGSPNSQQMLKFLFERSRMEVYDAVVVDTPPSIGLLFQNTMNASNYFLIPTLAEPDSFDGIVEMFTEVTSIRKVNRSLICLGILITNYNANNRVHNDFLPEIEAWAQSYSLNLFSTKIKTSKAISTASAERMPIPLTTTTNNARGGYANLVIELLPLLRGRRRGNVTKIPSIKKGPKRNMDRVQRI